jgi:hypothetical protein
MSPAIIRTLIAVVLIAHGLIYFGMTIVPLPQPGGMQTPFWPSWWRDAVDNQWLAVRLGLAPQAVRLAGSLLWVIALAGFVLAGLGILGVPGLNAFWQLSAGVAAAVSLLLFLFYWHSWLVVGAAINVAVLAALWQNWPAALFGTN